MTDSLAIYNQFNQLQQAASALYKSGYFKDAASEAQAIVKVMAGAELGLPPFASMTGINIIQGKPALGSNVIATLVKNDPRYDYNIETCDNTTCTIIWFENGKQRGVSSFTIQEAQNAGLTGKDNWKKYPSDMLFARAISRGARRYAPGVFGGSPVYTADELGADTDEDGNIVDVQVRDVTHEPEPFASFEEHKPTMSLEFAENETSSTGERYGDLDSEKLNYMTLGINKGLAKPGLTQDKIDEYNRKKAAIETILAHRNA
jgi:hypothetical protein